MCCKVFGSSGDEARAGGAFLVRQDLRIRQPAVVIDHRMQVVIADAAVTDLFAAPMSSPSTTVGDAAQLLDVDVDQFAGTIMLSTPVIGSQSRR